MSIEYECYRSLEMILILGSSSNSMMHESTNIGQKAPEKYTRKIELINHIARLLLKGSEFGM